MNKGVSIYVNEYRLLALDMDGTLLNNEKEVSPENKKWIQKLEGEGVPVVLATGRGYQRVVHIQQELTINQPMVLVNGAEIWKSQTDLLERTFIPNENIRLLREIALEYHAPFWGYTTENMVKQKDFSEEMLQWNWLKFGFKHQETEVVSRIREEILESMEIVCTSSSPHNIECAPAGLSKETGLVQVCNFLGMSMDEVVSVGDNLNDTEMIKAAGMGVAMGNAPNHVKEIADMTTYTNEQDGVAHVIQHLFFDK